LHSQYVTMTEIKTPFDATTRGKEILRLIGYTYGKASVVVIGQEENLWKLSALTTDFIYIKMIIDGEGFLKNLTTDAKKYSPHVND